MFNGSMVNILWAFVAGERFRHDDPKLKELVNSVGYFFKFNPSIFAFPIPKLVIRIFSNHLAKVYRDPRKQIEFIQNFVDVSVSSPLIAMKFNNET